MAKKKPQKKQKNKNWDVVGYYIDYDNAYTMLEHKKDRNKHRVIKGI